MISYFKQKLNYLDLFKIICVPNWTGYCLSRGENKINTVEVWVLWEIFHFLAVFNQLFVKLFT